MKRIKFYEFADCNTCRKALKFLANRRYAVEKIDIFYNPPTREEILTMIGHYKGKYLSLLTPADKRTQELGLAERAQTMTQDELVEMLAWDGKLFKRPFVLTDNVGLVGFQEEIWDKHFPKD